MAQKPVTPTAVLTVALGLTSLGASAQGSSGGASDAREAAQIAQQSNPGKVLSVKNEGNHYKVKILHEGKVKYVVIRSK